MQSLIRKGVLVRLIGVYAGNLEAETGGKQMLLLDQAPQKDRKLAAAMDDITATLRRTGNHPRRTGVRKKRCNA